MRLLGGMSTRVLESPAIRAHLLKGWRMPKCRDPSTEGYSNRSAPSRDEATLPGLTIPYFTSRKS